MWMKKMLNEGNQIPTNFISSSGSGSDFLTSLGSSSGSVSQKVTVPVPVPVPQHCPAATELTHLFATSDHNSCGEDELEALGERLGVEEVVVHVLWGGLQLAVPHQQAVGSQAPRCLRHHQVKMTSVSVSHLLNIYGSHDEQVIISTDFILYKRGTGRL